MSAFNTEIQNKIIELHEQGYPVLKIISILQAGTDEGVRNFLKRSGRTPHKSPSRKKERVATCQSCGQIFEYKYTGNGKVCSRVCSGVLSAQRLSKYSESDVQSVIDLKKLGVPNRIIADKTGVNINKIKEIVKGHGLYLSAQARQENAYHHKLIKNPNAMADMRSHMTKEDKERRRAKASAAMRVYNKNAQPRDKIAGIAKDRQGPFFYLKHQQALDTRRESVLGCTIEEFDRRLLCIKRDVEEKKGTVCTLSERYGISFITACRHFHKNGWSDLVQSKSSRAELDLFNYVRDLMGNEIEVRSADRTAIPPLELDIYIPSKKLGIEYNGLYWHSMASGFKRGAHALKKRVMAAAGISLLAIYEDEYINKLDLVKAMIRWRLGKFDGQRLRASSLRLVKFEKNAEFQDFFDRNHLDGHVKASYAYALADQSGKVIVCASVRTNHRGELEIARFATDYDYNVPGGFSKILMTLPRPIVSYSNNRLSDGRVYESLGFREITSTTAPSYWYTDFEHRVWRFKCRRVNDPSVLEKFPSEEAQAKGGIFSLREFGDDRPLYRIEDYGHRKWIIT